MREILAIDPGLQGAFVYLSFHGQFKHHVMPVIKNDKNKEIDFNVVREIFDDYIGVHIFLERAHPGAMGVTGAFNYGRGFAAIEIAIQLAGNPVTYIEPAKWCKVMHAGINADLKPKAKSVIAVNRLYKKQLKQIPCNRNGKLHDGVVDALLIAGYGIRSSL